MADESKAPKSFDELRKMDNKKKVVETKDLIEHFATRELLERDYKEDLLKVKFSTSSTPEIKRLVNAKRPTPEQMTEIFKLNAKIVLLSMGNTPKTAEKLADIYEQMSKIAADLSVDKSLNKEFWFKKISTNTLNNFIGELITLTQQGPIDEESMKSFRK